MLNALLSGSLHGGIQIIRLAFAGESATGKTYFVLGIMKAFLDSNPEAGVMFYDTEAAVTKAMMEEEVLMYQELLYLTSNNPKFNHMLLSQ